MSGYSNSDSCCSSSSGSDTTQSTAKRRKLCSYSQAVRDKTMTTKQIQDLSRFPHIAWFLGFREDNIDY